MLYIQNGPYLQEPKKNSMMICWETDREASGEVRVYQADLPHVPVSAAPVCGEARVYKGSAGVMHRVVADDLEPGACYYYEVCSEAEDGERIVSQKFSFKTAPDADAAFSFVLTAENGGASKELCQYTAPITELIRRERPDFVQSVGDLLWDGRQGSQWNFYFFEPFRRILCNTPFFPCVGNHEVGGSAVRDELVAASYSQYEKYFPSRRNYSYDYGCAHFCVLDCPSMFERIDRNDTDAYIPVLKPDFENSEAFRFLENDLAQTKAVWKFVIFHYPPYTSAIFDGRELQCFAPLFERFGVDIVFNSHAILYERSHPIRAGKLNRSGVRYILVGGYADFDRWFRDKSNGLSAKRAARPNYVRVSITPWSLELQAIDYEGKLVDVLTLEKEA